MKMTIVVQKVINGEAVEEARAEAFPHGFRDHDGSTYDGYVAVFGPDEACFHWDRHGLAKEGKEPREWRTWHGAPEKGQAMWEVNWGPPEAP